MALQESDEDKDDESVRHLGYSPNSSREELSYHGGSHRGHAASPLADRDHNSGRGQDHNSGRGQASNIQSATESESEDEYVFVLIVRIV